MKKTLFQMIEKFADDDKNFIFIKAEMGYLPEYQEKFPNQYLDVGIAEQNMIGVAAGMALQGYHPMVYSIVNFTTMRCLEQIRHNIAYHNLNIKIVSCGQGFDYGSLGPTHHATEDIAIMRALPNMTIFCPADSIETRAALMEAMRISTPCYLRLGSGGEKNLHNKVLENYTIGKILPLIEGDDIVILSSGSIISEALLAAREMNNQNIHVGVYSVLTIKPIDADFIREKAKKARLILTVEEHSIIGGLGSAVSEVLSEMLNKNCKFKRVGVEDTFSYEVGKQQYLREFYKLNAGSIEREIMILLENLQ